MLPPPCPQLLHGLHRAVACSGGFSSQGTGSPSSWGCQARRGRVLSPSIADSVTSCLPASLAPNTAQTYFLVSLVRTAPRVASRQVIPRWPHLSKDHNAVHGTRGTEKGKRKDASGGGADWCSEHPSIQTGVTASDGGCPSPAWEYLTNPSMNFWLLSGASQGGSSATGLAQAEFLAGRRLAVPLPTRWPPDLPPCSAPVRLPPPCSSHPTPAPPPFLCYQLRLQATLACARHRGSEAQRWQVNCR